MSSDGSPILIDLLDSLTSINKRLNLIETALSIQAAEQRDGVADPFSAAAAGVGAGAALPQSRPQSVATSPQAVAQRYGQPPPPPYQCYAQSATLFSASTDAELSITHSPNHIHAAVASASRPPCPTRSAQLLRLENMHAKDQTSDDGTGYEVDTSDGDVHMKNSGEGDPCEAEDIDADPAAKEDTPMSVPCEAHAYAEETQQSHAQSSDPKPAQHQPGPSTTNAPLPPLPPLPPTPVAEGARLEALPEGFIVTGRATLQEELDGWTIPRGYSMRINGTRSHGQRQKIRMVCFRGGRSRLRPKEEEEERQSEVDREREREGEESGPPSSLVSRRRKPTTDRVSKKCECPFRFELVELCPGADEYAVHYTNDDHMQHNHAAADLMLDPRARKLPPALKAEVDQWLRGDTDSDKNKDKAWTIAAIQAELHRRGYGHVLDFDLRNRKRALLHKERVAQQQEASADNTPSAG